MLHGRLMLVVGLNRVDNHCSGLLADLKSRKFHRSKGSFEHVADTMACHAQDPDILRSMQTVILEGPDRSHSLRIRGSEDRVQFHVSINKFHGTVVAVLHSAELGFAFSSDLGKRKFPDSLFVASITVRIGRDLLRAVDQADLPTSLLVKELDGLIGFAGCVPDLICLAREVFANPDKHTLKEAQDWSDRIYHISQAIYGGGQPSGEAHARLKETLYQRGIFKNALMRKPISERLGFDPAEVRRLSFKEILKKVGPGIILTGIVIGPGFSSLLGNTQRGVVLLNAGLLMVLILWKQERYTGYKTPRVLRRPLF